MQAGGEKCGLTSCLAGADGLRAAIGLAKGLAKELGEPGEPAAQHVCATGVMTVAFGGCLFGVFVDFAAADW